MTTCGEIVRFMEGLAPSALAEEWDNVGLLVGTEKAVISKIMLCLDITSVTVKEAVAEKADMIITHHPVIFKGLKSLTGDDEKGRLLYELVRNGISVFTAHTNLDFAEPGVNTCLAEALGLNGLQTLGNGPGKTGSLEKATSLESFTELVKNALGTPVIRVAGKIDREVSRVAVFSGSFDEDLAALRQSGADVLVTGDLKYHTALDAIEAGFCIIDAGHYNTEKVVLSWLMDVLKGKYPELEICCSAKEKDPYKTY